MWLRECSKEGWPQVRIEARKEHGEVMAVVVLGRSVDADLPE